MRSRRSRVVPIACLAAVASLAACVRTEQVLVDIPAFEDPPTAAQGFLGYTNSESRVPVCGNCHVGQHSEWKNTRHARAWEDLQASGHAQGSCENCHSVGANGNLVSDAMVGYAATKDKRYEDVQCESCHGPGLEHVTNPDATQPYASLLVGTELTNGCGECHQGTHTPFVEEWSQSRHAAVGTSPQSRVECQPCHEARGILAAWGIKANYIEKSQTAPIPITCPVCHDPHDPTNAHQLRFPINVANVEVNLCMKCHHNRSIPDPNSSRGPHSPQGPLLLGEAGWQPPGFAYPGTKIIATHGSTANPELCAGCHVSNFDVTDPATGAFVFHATGHLFNAIPCLDAQGKPTTSDSCQLTERTFKACAVSGCHGSDTAARSAFIVARGRLDDLMASANALLAQVPATEYKTGDDLITAAEGAKFNVGLAEMDGSTVHNPFLVEALLTASIKELMTVYGLSAPPGISLQNQLDPGT